MPRTFKEVTYVCTKDTCRHSQTIRYFPDDPILSVTCCVKCRSGFNLDLKDMLDLGKGMFPTSRPTMVSA